MTSILTSDFALPLHDPILVFLVLLSIVLLIPSLFKRINLPSIIGLIIAGILVGPHGFNILSDDAGMEMFSTIGLMYIMFAAGLELTSTNSWQTRIKSCLWIFHFTLVACRLPRLPLHFVYDPMPAFHGKHVLYTYPGFVSYRQPDGVSKTRLLPLR